MPKASFSIRTLLLLVTLVALYFPTRAIYEPWQESRLRVSHAMFHDFSVLAKLTEGDSLEEVSRHYDSLRPIDSNSPLHSRLKMEFAALNNLTFDETDEFYEYRTHGDGNFGYLQFRDGLLVNHPSDIFGDPVANTVRNKSALPGVFDRMGVWPVYIIVVIVFLTIWILAVRIFENHTNTAVNQGT